MPVSPEQKAREIVTLIELLAAQEEVEAWKEASGLERGGDPDVVKPGRLSAFIRQQDGEIARLRAVIDVLLLAFGEGAKVDLEDGVTWTVERPWDDAPSVLDYDNPADISLEDCDSLVEWLRDDDVTVCSALAGPEEG
jgi:hypothetical protein